MAMQRCPQVVLIATFLPLCWLGMQAVHELGHVAAAYLTGGEVLGVVLHPLRLSRTDVGTNPHPLAVVWAGPIVGVLLPTAMWAAASALRTPMLYLFRFFAGFCLVANGVYIGFGPGDTGLDTEIMLLHGSSRTLMLGFGLPAVLLGLYLWHGQGSHFGLGNASGSVEKSAALLSAALLVVVVAIELTVAAG